MNTKTPILPALVFVLLSGYTSVAQDQEDWDWVNKHYQNVLDEYMPIKERLGYTLGYRSYRDLYTDELEYSFAFNRILQEKHITVVVRHANSVSLYDQIMALRRKRPDDSIDNIKKQLKVTERQFSEETCSAVKKQYDEFYRLILPMLSARDRKGQIKGELPFTLHPRVHVFNGHISGGNMRLVITEQDHPFVLWAKRTRLALEACKPSSARPNRQP